MSGGPSLAWHCLGSRRPPARFARFTGEWAAGFIREWAKLLQSALDLGAQFRLAWQVQLVFAGKDLLILLRLHMVHDGVVHFAAQEASRNLDTRTQSSSPLNSSQPSAKNPSAISNRQNTDIFGPSLTFRPGT